MWTRLSSEKLEQLIKDEHPQFKGFVDLGSCVFHIVHNAFGKGWAFIFSPFVSTVLQEERTIRSCSLTWGLTFRSFSITMMYVGYALGLQSEGLLSSGMLYFNSQRTLKEKGQGLLSEQLQS